MLAAAAVVLAGGSGSRVGATGNKVYLPVAGRPLLSWALESFAAAPSVRRLVLVARPADLPLAADAADRTGGDVEIVPGGATRHGSEWAALSHLGPAIRAGELAVVAVHDGARPLARCRLIEDTIEAARMHGAAVPGVPLPDAGVVDPAHGVRTEPPTRRLVRVQTPQAFRADLLLDAYERAERDGFAGTDTAACVERYAGLRVHCLPGDPRNVKVTYPADLELAAALLAQ
ncbi:MAG: 2-C-methyl-D-erythritol 4-phosphate cytidylyltransferase [Mycobacteriales bacterium]